MEHTRAAIEKELLKTRDDMYAADLASAEAELTVVKCRAHLDELLDEFIHLPKQRLPSEDTRGRTPQPY